MMKKTNCLEENFFFYGYGNVMRRIETKYLSIVPYFKSIKNHVKRTGECLSLPIIKRDVNFFGTSLNFGVNYDFLYEYIELWKTHEKDEPYADVFRSIRSSNLSHYLKPDDVKLFHRYMVEYFQQLPKDILMMCGGLLCKKKAMLEYYVGLSVLAEKMQMAGLLKKCEIAMATVIWGCSSEEIDSYLECKE